MKKNVVKALLAIVFGSVNTVFADINKTVSPISIDGELDETVWDVSNAFPFSNGTTDNTAFYDILWDDEYLYVAVSVNDNDVIQNGRQGWYDDGIEICIDANNAAGTDFGADDRQILCPVKSYWIQEMNSNFDGVKYAWTETPIGYNIEVAIPWSNMGVTASAGMDLGFQLVVNDQDIMGYTPDPPQLQLFQISDYFDSPQNWGTMTLSAQTVSAQADFIALEYPNEGVFAINGGTIPITWKSDGVSNVKIEYSVNNGSSWSVLANSVVASQEVYDWTVTQTASTEALIRVSDASNASTTDVSNGVFAISEQLNGVTPIIKAQWENYSWPIDAYYPYGQNGVQTGNACGPTSLARIMHSFEFPRKGNGELTFTDNYGTIWSADFETEEYNYDNMPIDFIGTVTEPEYQDVAKLCADAAVSMHDLGGSGTDLANMASAMSTYFNYQPATPVLRSDLSQAEWAQMLIDELDAGRSLLVQGMLREPCGEWHDGNCIAGHWYHCDGYNANGEFHVVIGFGNYQYDGYYKVDEFPLYGFNNGVLVGLEPDLDGKTLSLTSPNGGESYASGSQVSIAWQQQGVSNIDIEYSVDAGLNWQTIATNVDASSGNYDWTSPTIASVQVKVRITDNSNINVFDRSDATFSLQTYDLVIDKPSGTERLVTGNKTLIQWQNTAVQQINIEYSTDNGTSWQTVADSVSTSLETFVWSIPMVTSEEYKIRITDVEDGNVSYTSPVFAVQNPNEVGGPYRNDSHTRLLMNFEGNYFNQFSSMEDAVLHGNVSLDENTVDEMSSCIYIDEGSYLSIPHCAGLNLSEDWTIECWMKPTAFVNHYQYLFDKPGDDIPYEANYALQLNSYWNNDLFGYYFDGPDSRIGINQSIISLNTWYHVAFIRDDSDNRLRLIVRDENRNIVLDEFVPDGGGVPMTSNQDLLIGFGFEGMLDELRISDVVRTFEPSGVNEPSTVEFGIYPNPTSNQVYIQCSDRLDVQIVDMNGSIIMHKTNAQSTSVDVSGLASGVYLIRAYQNGKVGHQKFIVQ